MTRQATAYIWAGVMQQNRLSRQAAGLARFAVLLWALQFTPVALVAQGAPVSRFTKLELRLRLDGLYPKSLNVETGQFEIVFANPTFIASLDFLVIQADTGKLVAQTTSGGKIRHPSDLKMELPPGNYQLQDAGRPAWTAVLTVTPKGKL